MPAESPDKKTVILLHAEELFANFGLHGVSIRDIAVAARVPPTLVIYHFKTKEGLYQAVFESRARALNTIREKALQPLLEGPERPEVEDVLHALAKPWFDIRRVRGGVSYARLIAREVSDPDEASRGIIAKTLDPVARRFFEALERALPEVSSSQLHWAGHYFIAALLMMMANTGRIERLSGKHCKVGKSNETQIVGHFARLLRGLASDRSAKRPRPRARGQNDSRRRSRPHGTL